MKSIKKAYVKLSFTLRKVMLCVVYTMIFVVSVVERC